MASLVFVHGTGVRCKAFDARQQEISAALVTEFGAREAPKFVPCLWGDPAGVHLAFEGKSIPAYRETNGGSVVRADLWEVLEFDPLFELRAFAEKGNDDRVLDVVAYEQRLQALPGENGSPLLTQQALIAAFDRARGFVCRHRVFDAAVECAGSELQLNSMVARAIVASILCHEPYLSYTFALRKDVAERDRLVAALTEDLGGTAMGFFDWGRALFGIAYVLGAAGSQWLEHHRGQLTDAMLPALGDILYYQKDGAKIRDLIREKILLASGDPPVVVLAHSLGGVACVDLLLESSELVGEWGVRTLVTIGSQAPLLYEIGALRHLACGNPIPESFPTWLNVYHRRDFLSFVGGDLFPKRADGSVGIEDIETLAPVSVPDAHSVYFDDPALWKVVRRAFAT